MSRGEKPLVHVVVGPTAVGKTDYAIALAKKLKARVISVDSRQLYVGMNIGTAKPEAIWKNPLHSHLAAEEIKGILHYLFNIAIPSSPITLGRWQTLAKEVLAEITSHGEPVIIVGGTMLYVDSLLDWYDIPAVSPDIEFRKSLEKLSTSDLYEQLLLLDKEAQDFIEPHHKQRIIRALEVIQTTKKPFSESRLKKEAPYTFSVTGIFPEGEAGWEILRSRIKTRITAMFSEIFLAEVKELKGIYGSDLPLLKTMNYKEAVQVLRGDLSLEEAAEEALRSNMRYARRQMNWWKRRQDITWIPLP